jgi:hypothetical protein
MRIALLGSGWLGRFFPAGQDHEVLHTARKERQGAAIFDSEDPTTWGAVRGWRPDGIVVTFPAGPCSDPAALADFLRSFDAPVVAVGTTSSLVASQGEITDASPADPNDPRAAAEEYLLRAGAAVLHSAGLYGPGRNPLDWVRRGRIGSAAKLVNLVHGGDVARACRFLLEHPRRGERLVLSDGRPRRWADIVAFAVRSGWLADPGLPAIPVAPRRVSPRTLPAMGFTYRHPDLEAELALLEGALR